MRICIYTQDVSAILGGVQRVVALVADHLAVMGHEVTILCPDSGVNSSQRREPSSHVRLVRTNLIGGTRPSLLHRACSRLILAGVKRGPSPTLPRFLNPLLRWAFLRRAGSAGVRSFLTSEDFDLIVGAGAQQSLFLSLIADRIDARTVGWTHSTFDSYFSFRGRNLHGLETLARASFPRLDAVLVLNSTDRLAFDSRLGIASEVFGNPVSLPEQVSETAEDPRTIVFLGRISFAHKGVDLLVDAFHRVHERHPDWALQVYGDGPDREALRNLISERRLDMSIELMGATRDIGGALASGSIFAFPSRYEGFGISLVEAMRMGLPSVSFACDGPRDILVDGVTGFLVEPGDAMALAERLIELIEDRELRRSMGRRAAAAAAAYDPSRLVPEFVRLVGGN